MVNNGRNTNLTLEEMQQTLDLVHRYGSQQAAADAIGMPHSTFKSRFYRAKTELRNAQRILQDWTYPQFLQYQIKDGCVLVGGDTHFWPDQKAFIYDCFVEVAHELKPKLIILNGDLVDGTRVSRHPRLRNQITPKTRDEFREAERQTKRLPAGGYKAISMGNHDQRLDNYLANSAQEVEDMAMGLQDFFPDFGIGYAVLINQGLPFVIPCEVRHTYKGGIHARRNNVLYSGIHIVTNHTHALGVTNHTNRMGTLYSVETGTMAWDDLPQFEYTQGQITQAKPGFAVLTFDAEGNMMHPELAIWDNGKLMFRGKAWGLNAT